MSDFGALPLAPQRRVASDDNMIPLINIVFLLLIFFMVASRIDAFRPADIALPEVGEVGAKADMKDVSIVIEASGDIYSGGRPISSQALNAWISTLDLSVPGTTVSLQVDKHVTAAALSPVLAILRENQIPKITLYVQRAVSVDS